MTCVPPKNSNQSEFEFFQNLVASNNPSDCVGPVTEIVISQTYLIKAMSTLVQQGIDITYLDKNPSTVLDSSHAGLIHCSRHWIKFIKDIGKIAAEQNDKILFQLSFYMLRVLCLSNLWDYKELLNYLKTYSMIDQSN